LKRSAGRAITAFVIALFWISTAVCGTNEIKPDKPHHNKGRFRNVHLKDDRSFFDFLRWRLQRLWKDIPPPESYNFPLAENDPSFLRANKEKVTLTWIGHATLLFQVNGKNILTDPHFSERASPVKWAGPKRVVQPGLAIGDLPQIDAVVISHDHYDSLDEQTVMKLFEREGGDSTLFLVPLGMKKWFQKRGIGNVAELDWWEDHGLGTLRIIAVPMQHWSKRNPLIRNNRLWASWIVMSEDFRFYFGGDTGYSPHFREIGDKFGPFDLSAMPIGAYEPRWFMRRHHVNPEEAVQAHIDLGAEKSIGIHWGTFMLTDEPLDEPPELLKKALKEKGIPEDRFKVLMHGETVVLK
jgi:L-ascorbate metabolism protein UlaG (beta-lactamase superfamily)